MFKLSYDQLLERAGSIPLAGKKLYGIPRGGTYAALLCNIEHQSALVVDNPHEADVFVDDIIDSGRTRDRYLKAFSKPFYALVDKTKQDGYLKGKWITFPWECTNNEVGVEENIVRLLEYIGEDPKREGLLETPSRVIRAYDEIFAGYKQDPETILKTFEDGAHGYDEMVILKDIEFSSTCEHHMMGFFGKAHIAYIPNGKIVGLSKLARLLEVYSRRLQVQERLTTQITAALDKHLQPKGSACVLEASHGCMVCRGIKKQNSVMITSSLTGVFRTQPETRSEFFKLIGK